MEIIKILLVLSVFIGQAAAQVNFDNPIINEFMPNPCGSLETEWVEIYNISDYAVNLQNYKIGDELGWRTISDSSIILSPGAYIILAQDRVRFIEYYIDFEGVAIEPAGWAILNNDGDIIRLANADSETVDSVVYDDSFENNCSWERFIDANGQSFWGGSFEPSGSTPGRANNYFYPRSPSIIIEIVPDPFSPDGDGFEDETVIRINPPEGDALELTVYDMSGNRVKTFIEGDNCIPREIVWDGRDDNGRRLPVGIYVLYAAVDSDGSFECKRTIVIAR